MLTFLFLFFAQDQILITKTGESFFCTEYKLSASLVLIRSGRELYSLPADRIDWDQTRERQLARNERVVKDSIQTEPQDGTVNDEMPDFLINKFDVKDASLIDVLRFLSDMANLNLVVDGSVPDSKATYFLQNISWRTAFDIVTRNAGLHYQWLHGAVWVKPLL